MGFLSNCNFFTESDFNDYRRLDKILNEADEDDDLGDDESESNFDMPDDDQDDTDQQTEDNPQEPAAEDDTGDDNNLGVDDSESNFDMPDDEDQQQTDDGVETGDEPDTQSMDDGDTAVQSDPAPDTSTQDGDSGDDDLGDDESESDFDLPDDDGDQQQGDQIDNANADDGGDDLGDDGSESNFDMDDGDGTGADTSDDGTDDTGMDDTSTGEDPDQDLKDAENDIFNGLSDQDKTIKINELKDLYQDLYNRIVTLYDKVNDIPKDDELIKVYNFIIDNLSDLKQFVYDYLTNTFDNKTYLENMVNYKKYLSTLNVINGILEEIRKGLYKESGN